MPSTKQKAELIYQNKSLFPTNFDFNHGKAKPRIRKTAATSDRIILVKGNICIPFAAKKAYVAHTVRINPTVIAVKLGYQCPLSTIWTILLPAPKNRKLFAPQNTQKKMK
ncbi:hypothetical protein APD39_13840 [Acinetobacter pittii]|nr:hypothetical protein APD12_15580 [Acinetobacter pittii]KQE24250.1 hypothetical protein APD38_06545 [Acinetobacter pittii]KQE27495.1 hypothetical protein APD39_13840 [Acinetobacter pittii]KQE52876.1 hypothetical protein APD46_04770 [Acinetobacter pittii]KQF70776.1 hypothetical protein APC19_07515 [Acinetobacter pittii]